MAWTYSGDPRDSDVDEVRFLIGDTVSTSPLAQDEEILYAIEKNPTILMAAVTVARSVSMRLAQAVDKQVGDLKISASARHKNYLSVLENLEERAGQGLATPFGGGISKSRKELNDADADLVEPGIRTDQFKNRQTSYRDDTC